jgi:hypothetical protein
MSTARTIAFALLLAASTARAGTVANDPPPVRLAGSDAPAGSAVWTDHNTQSIGNTEIAHLIINLGTPRTNANGMTYRSIGFLVELDCHAGKTALLSMNARSDPWGSGRGVSTQDYPRKMIAPRKGTVEDALLQYHCRVH